MIDFSHLINVLTTGTLLTCRDQKTDEFFYDIATVQILAWLEDPVSWKMTAHKNEGELLYKKLEYSNRN